MRDDEQAQGLDPGPQASETAPTPELGIFHGAFPSAQALEKLRNRLLDLSNRNRLLNYRHPRGKSAQIVNVDFNGVFKRLVDGRECVFRWVPEPGPLEYSGQRPDPRTWAAEKHGINVSVLLAQSNSRLPANSNSSRSLWALQYPQELTRLLHNIARDARLAIEETGTNMLYLVFGFLEFYDAPHSEKPLLAPLIAVPVLLAKKGVVSGYDTYEVSYTGDDIRENLTLREKLKQDFSLHLPAFDEDRHAEDADAYLDDVADIVANKPSWKVKRQITLAMLSFGKLALWAELDPAKWPELLDHPIVKELFEGNTRDPGNGDDDVCVDDLEAFDQLIYDADSSQHNALVDVLQGKTLVINGPPGTGKSQTITNMIASSLAEGRSVLFVAEKSAALEVVTRRLEGAGLADFCLELHSHKSQKKKLLSDLATRIEGKYRVPPDVISKRKSLGEKKLVLRQYVETLNMVLGNELGMTAFDVLWAADRRRGQLGPLASVAEAIALPFALSARPEHFAGLRTLVEGLSRHYTETRSFDRTHPWFGFYPTTYPAGLELHLKRLLDELSSAAHALQTEILSLCHELQLDWPEASRCRAWVDVASALERVGPPPEVPRGLIAALFSGQRAVAVRSVLEELGRRIAKVRSLENKFRNRLVDDAQVTDAAVASARRHLVSLNDLGLSDLRLIDLRDRPRALRALSTRIEQALHVLGELAEIADLPWETTAQDVAHIRDLGTIARNAPVDLLPYRRPSFEAANIGAHLSKARKQAFELRQLRSKLIESLYLDQEPDRHELQRAISTLRQGDGLFRWLNGEWRKARKLHRSLSRTRIKQSAQERAEELSELARLLTAEEALNSSAEYAAAFGQLFAGVETDWGKVDQLATWYRMSQQVLAETEIPAPKVDLTAISAARLAQVKARDRLLQETVKVLSEAHAEMVGAFGEDFMHVDGPTSGKKSWKALVADLKRVADIVESAIGNLGILCNVECKAIDAVDAIEACAAYGPAVEAVRGYSEAQVILGEFFAGVDTDLELSGTAYSWGRGVIESTLPDQLKTLLLRGADPPRTYTVSRAAAKRIAALWESVQTFGKGMRALGEFRVEDWLPEPNDDPARISTRCDLARSNLDRLLAWSQYNRHREEALRNQLAPFVGMIENGQVSPKELALAFEFCFFHSIAVSLFHSRPELAGFSTTAHEQIRAEFAALDREIIKLTGKDFASRIARGAKVPEGTSGPSAGDYTERRLLLREIGKQKKHIPIRQLLKRAGKAILAYKPCFMMSPLSVAHYLEPGIIKFDLVVMDEASQIRPEDAIGAIARGAQVVVVGDPKQLPPTNFFDRMTDSGDDEEGEEATVDATRGTESILDVFQQRFPTRSLNWHYRSRHQSLIAFSNRHFYDNKLVIFPAPYPSNAMLGLHYHHVHDGNYEGRQNIPEAMRVVNDAINHMRSNPGQSLGIVTLAITQRDLIELLFDKHSRNFPEVQEYLSTWANKDGYAEPFFIKNLENVQGDERDVIYISTTFGPRDGTGPVAQNFGPISKQGGWRRLNVLFTRAKQGAHVFTSMHPGDIVVDARTPEGTRALRNYIEYARSGVLEGSDHNGREPDSDFEVSVAEVLRGRGFEVVPQLGVAGFFIDLAVRNPHRPGELLAAIECDGAAYHSGASVRDRDRIRQEILEGLGWRGKIFRIWSTDWYRDRATQTRKLLQFLHAREQEAVTVAATAARAAPQPLEGELPLLAREAVAGYAPEPEIATLDEAPGEIPFVEIRDTVTYILTAHPRDRKTVTIVDGPSNPAEGKLNCEAPVATALLGLETDGEEELIVDGRRVGLVRVLNIKKLA